LPIPLKVDAISTSHHKSTNYIEFRSRDEGASGLEVLFLAVFPAFRKQARRSFYIWDGGWFLAISDFQATGNSTTAMQLMFCLRMRSTVGAWLFYISSWISCTGLVRSVCRFFFAVFSLLVSFVLRRYHLLFWIGVGLGWLSCVCFFFLMRVNAALRSN